MLYAMDYANYWESEWESQGFYNLEEWVDTDHCNKQMRAVTVEIKGSPGEVLIWTYRDGLQERGI